MTDIDQQLTLTSEFTPSGDQPAAISSLTRSLHQGEKHQTLRGVTGSGKTFTMANIIANTQFPTLVMAPNKTLAAQLFTELKELFQQNSVGFFISYYDYYQPEAYVPTTDTYIAKDSSINDDIDKMRHAATRALFEDKKVVIVASVSCIYGLGSPKAYSEQMVPVSVGQSTDRNQFLKSLVGIQYHRNDTALSRGCFRVRGDTVDLLPSHQSDQAIRIEFFDDEIESIRIVDALTSKTVEEVQSLSIYPNSHYVTDQKDIQEIVQQILSDLGYRLRELRQQNKLVECQRLEQRTMNDVELIEELGFCPGIENYSRYLTGKKPGEAPPTLLDYFPDEFLTIIDESHITVPQIGGMYRGDRSRKQNLVDFGFRLPSALDNRPLDFDEFLQKTNRLLYVSATPGPYELKQSGDHIVEQIIRPTGLLDPVITIKPAKNQIDDLLEEIKATTSKGYRILVTTLTKAMAESISSYYKDLGIRIRYLHSDIDSIERMELLRELRQGTYDVLVGINLLREGLDLPEVGLVAILDADKESFLRSFASLTQTVGRAARNAEGRVIFYGDRTSDSMAQCIAETAARREKQAAHNAKHNKQPRTVLSAIKPGLREIYGLEKDEPEQSGVPKQPQNLQELGLKNARDIDKLMKKKANQMKKLAAELEFEKAAALRDEIAGLRELKLTLDDSTIS